jgi:hypothetical protein
VVQQYLPIPEVIDIKKLPSIPLVERRKLPMESGIYFVLEGTTVRYVGRTIALRARWKGHHRLGSYRSKEGLRIAWLTVSDRALLQFVEAACIAFFGPSDNNTRIEEDKRKPDPFPDVDKTIKAVYSWQMTADIVKRLSTLTGFSQAAICHDAILAAEALATADLYAYAARFIPGVRTREVLYD